jgi:hypothetical protein
MKQNYNQNYGRCGIAAILGQIHDCVRSNRFTVSVNDSREENRRFIYEYNLTHAKIAELLLAIDVADFCHSLRNIKPGYEHETLYVFCPQVQLYNLTGNRERVDVYTKFNLITTAGGNRVVVISLHPRNKPINYCFPRLKG